MDRQIKDALLKIIGKVEETKLDPNANGFTIVGENGEIFIRVFDDGILIKTHIAVGEHVQQLENMITSDDPGHAPLLKLHELLRPKWEALRQATEEFMKAMQ